LAKAEDPAASPEEAQAYFAKAAELMARYGIEQAMLAEARPEMDKPTSRVVIEKGAYLRDRVELLMQITTAIGGQAVRWRVWDQETRKYVQKVKLYGYESTLDRVEMLYTSLQLQAFNGMKHGRPLPGESTTSYRKTWLSGFRTAVVNRLSEAEELAVAETAPQLGGRSAELVLASRDETIRSIYTANHPKVRMPARRVLRGSGWSEGSAAGKRADLGGPRLAAPRRPALVG